MVPNFALSGSTIARTTRKPPHEEYHAQDTQRDDRPFEDAS